MRRNAFQCGQHAHWLAGWFGTASREVKGRWRDKERSFIHIIYIMKKCDHSLRLHACLMIKTVVEASTDKNKNKKKKKEMRAQSSYMRVVRCTLYVFVCVAHPCTLHRSYTRRQLNIPHMHAYVVQQTYNTAVNSSQVTTNNPLARPSGIGYACV